MSDTCSALAAITVNKNERLWINGTSFSVSRNVSLLARQPVKMILAKFEVLEEDTLKGLEYSLMRDLFLHLSGQEILSDDTFESKVEECATYFTEHEGVQRLVRDERYDVAYKHMFLALYPRE